MKNKWKKISIASAIAGLCCLVAAGFFVFYNMYDDSRAAHDLKSETEMIEALVLSSGNSGDRISNGGNGGTQSANAPILILPQDAQASQTAELETPRPDVPMPEGTPVPENMPVLTIDGTDFVAIISIPALDLEFSVRNEWSKEGLKKSPCRYVGSVYTDDLIICAHNYSSHFGRLKELTQGDEIILVDMNGTVYTYRVDRIEEIDRLDVSSMIDADFDLTLFTCTIGGKRRVTVRCYRDQ